MSWKFEGTKECVQNVGIHFILNAAVGDPSTGIFGYNHTSGFNAYLTMCEREYRGNTFWTVEVECERDGNTVAVVNIEPPLTGNVINSVIESFKDRVKQSHTH